MIRVEDLTYAYLDSAPTLRNVTLTIPDSAFVLVTGTSGAGKSTFLRALNGLVPHFYGGTFGGSVQINGFNTIGTPTRTLAQHIGFVAQDPESTFIVQRVEDEIAFGLENAGVSRPEMAARIANVLDRLGIAHLRTRNVGTLSGGEAQRTALAAALALHPRHIILDEPTSQLDPPAAHAFLDTLAALNREHGLTIILAEHRLERVLPYATHLLHFGESGVRFGAVRDVLPHSNLRPPMIEAALHLGWSPLPLSVHEARRFVPNSLPNDLPMWSPPAKQTGDLAVEVRGVTVTYGGNSGDKKNHTALYAVDWAIRRGEIVALLGVNGAGKSSLLKALVGLNKYSGSIRLNGRDAARMRLAERARFIGYVPQNPNSVLFAETLRDELIFTRRNHGLPGDAADFAARLGLGAHLERYPRDLSGGERQRAALAAMLASEPPIVLLDEPTRGLDYHQKRGVGELLRNWSSRGVTVIVATHDVEWVGALSNDGECRATVLQNGRIVADGAANHVLRTVPGFNTQLGELFGDPSFAFDHAINRATQETAESSPSHRGQPA
jgi:energy-coupling factor transport system ATP-binding protein